MMTGRKLLLIFLIAFSSIKAVAQNNDDSIKHVLPTTKDPKQKIKLLTTLSDDYSETNVDSSLRYTNALYALALKTKDRSAEAYAIGNLSFYYLHVGNLVRCMKLSFVSLQIFESIKDSVNIANAYNGIGHIYRAEKDWKNAYKYYRMERSLAVKINDHRDDAFGSLNLSYLFLKDHRLDSAMYYAKRVLELHDKYHIDFPRALTTTLIADVYDAKGDHITAMKMYRESMAYAAKINDPSLYQIQVEYAGLLYKAHQVDSALMYANKVLVNSANIILGERSHLYEILSNIYKDKGEYKAAFDYQDKATTLRDSLLNIEQTQETANLLSNEQQHQVDLKNAALGYQEKMNTRVRMYAIIGVAVVLLMIGIILWRNNRRQKQTNHLLSEQKEEIAAQRDEMESKNHELEIETSLERVRTVALAMQQPDDMLDVCRTICEQLTLLGVREIRNVQTAIIYESRGIYMNYEYYRLHNKTFITAADYSHPIQADFVSNMLIDGRYKGLKLEGKELEDWIEYQKTTNQFIDTHLAEAESLNYHWYSIGPVALGISLYAPISEENLALFRRFLEVFRLAYRRYKDVELALEQAKEARIEIALERVRAVAMAMKNPEELYDVCKVTYTELQALGFTSIRNAQISIFSEGTDINTAFEHSDNSSIKGTVTPLSSHPLLVEIANEIKISKDALFQKTISGEEFTTWRKWRNYIVPAVEPRLMEAESISFYLYATGHDVMGVSAYGKISDDQLEIIKRFKKVFELGYTRYADVAQAEAQAREGQIQLALERIRARTMAMQHSDELLETSTLLSQQFYDLGTNAQQISIGIVNEQRGVVELSATVRGAALSQTFDVRIDQPMMMGLTYNAWKEGKKSIEIVIKGEQLNEYNRLRNRESGYKFNFEEKGPDDQWIVNAVFFSQGMITCSTDTPITEETRQLLARFGSVFEQTYTRFLDLKQAEAQTKEGQVQLALERVRARTMAMQHSDELSETAYILFQQFKELGENPDQATIGIVNEDEWVIEYWVTMYGGQSSRSFKFSIDEPNVTNRIYRAWKAGERSLVIDLQGDELRDFSNYRAGVGGAAYNEAEQRRVVNVAFFAKGLINVQSIESRSAESIVLLERFATVFEGTYQRFLDLKKAEAQAHEALVEAALERVRSKTMAMHNSNDVGDAMATMFDQMVKLGVDATTRSGVAIVDGIKQMQIWTAYNNDEGKIDLAAGRIDMSTHQMLSAIYDHWKAGDTHSSYFLQGEDQKDYYRAINNSEDYHVHFKLIDLPERLFQNAFYFPEGFVYVFSPEALTADTVSTFKRFAGVFGLTYRRYLDLQKAESQALEAQIEAGLERVRSRTMAMQSSEELAETAAVVFRQLINLGIEPNRLFIGIIKDESGDIELWATDEDGSKVSTRFTGNANDNKSVKEMYQGWKDGTKSITIDMKGKVLKDYFHYLTDTLHVPFKFGLDQKRRLQTIAYFSQGFIGMASPDEQPKSTSSLLERFAGVFNLTYTRFNDLKIAEAHAIQAQQDLILLQTEKNRAEDALTELRATQTKLIQTEKMASLGELTAGIAHEIQNPLNFVNNFSEVSVELLQELKEEAEAGHIEDVMAIADDLVQNLGKISHHGKRADSIVKGMLEHSRVGTGEKQLTNINVMADEFLKLSYHGLRAKDKSFNAELIMRFDEQLPKINIAQQDVGRVLLNLFNNAFYAVNQKKKTAGNNYRPEVTVSTSTEKNNLIIKVKDNGNGIPDSVKDKIYQPFFTTKPTGEGTGLGLSLSYDILTKGHGGTITVNSKENEFTEFTVTLPIDK